MTVYHKMQESAIRENTPNDKNNLSEFINKAKARLKLILDRLQWSEQNVMKDFNNNSKAAANNDDAKDDIELQTSADPPLPDSCTCKNSVKLSQNELRTLINDSTAVVPQKFSDLQVNFTREQKLCLYNYVISCTGKCTEPEALVPALNEGRTTFAEIVAEKKRESKKRRRYRTTKPTYIEEVRGLVDLQMQALHQYFRARSVNDRQETQERSRSFETRRRLAERTHTFDEKRSKQRKRRSRSSSSCRESFKLNLKERTQSHHRHKRHKRRSLSRTRRHRSCSKETTYNLGSRHSESRTSSHRYKSKSIKHKRERSRSTERFKSEYKKAHR